VSPHKDIFIVGGGVIGVCAAYYLTKAGRKVTLIETGDICSGSSFGNAGFLLYSHIIPLSAPGVLGQGLKWLFDSTSPFYIKPRLSLDLVSWLWRFKEACTEKKTLRSMGVLSELARESRRLYERLSESEGLNFGYKAKGHLKLYRTVPGFEKGQREVEWMKQFHIEARLLETAQIRKMVPAVSHDIVGGIYFAGDAHLIPFDFVSGLAERVKQMGAEMLTGTEVLGFDVTGSEISAVRTTRGNFSLNQIVVAAGAHSPLLIRGLNLSLPIQGGKGYSVTYRYPGNHQEGISSLPVLLKEDAIAITPMDGMVRISGTLELSGLDMSINEKRILAFLNNAGRYIHIPEDLKLVEIWRGLRPCTPDGLPVIGRTKRYTNLILATGHATVGMGLGPVTGQLVARIVSGKLPGVDINPLGIERFN